MTKPYRDKLAGYDALIGASPALARIQTMVTQLANADSHVLVTGETGTGKELVAQLIHRNSSRAAGPLISLNCATLPEPLLESELFGHERAAFTGADTLSVGKLEHAKGGTVFFDEIGEMQPQVQAKLLRAVDTQEIYRLGGRHPVRLDIRVVAATNRNVEELVKTGAFRPDLYYRINVGRIHIPPLREHAEDIVPLAEHFLKELSMRAGFQVPGISAEVWEALENYSWPGNVRELRNVIEAALLSRPADSIEFLHLPDCFKSDLQSHSNGVDEHSRICTALHNAYWNKTCAAQALGWSRAKLYRKLREHKID